MQQHNIFFLNESHGVIIDSFFVGQHQNVHPKCFIKLQMALFVGQHQHDRRRVDQLECASNTFIQNEFDQIPILNLQHQHDGRRVDEPDEPASKPGQHPLSTQYQPQHTGEQELFQTNNMR